MNMSTRSVVRLIILYFIFVRFISVMGTSLMFLFAFLNQFFIGSGESNPIYDQVFRATGLTLMADLFILFALLFLFFNRRLLRGLLGLIERE